MGEVRITDLKSGERGRVSGWVEEVEGGGRGWGRRRGRGCECGRGRGWGRRLFEVLGLRPGQEVEVLENRGCGPVVLRVGESRFVLGRGQAARILVERAEERS
ncbi:FeoA family protein [Thermosulfurimonas sp. F29]|uniref:FeoA family protein n=1 Tax=Thermosulfurimonas sp. F29 TaxID=2867247 RepID=UPI001C829A81|nr:FeoA family protein [Thermosulfurimonas sp. F29]MBX6422223.1 ferrous iron transport protein A [Thermosulfurimonas sp. F29]